MSGNGGFNNNRANMFYNVGGDEEGQIHTNNILLNTHTNIPVSKRKIDFGREISKEDRDAILKKPWSELLEEMDDAHAEQEQIDRSISDQERKEIEQKARELMEHAKNRLPREKKQKEEPKKEVITLNHLEFTLPESPNFFKNNVMKDPFYFIDTNLRASVVNHSYFKEVMLNYLNDYNIPFNDR